MNTLVLLAGAYLVLQPKGTSAPQQQAPPPPAPRPAQGADIAAAFGAFVGGMLDSLSKSSNNTTN